MLANKTGNLRAAEHGEAAQADSVIWLFMVGGVSHLESFDPKPLLEQIRGQDVCANALSTAEVTLAMRETFALFAGDDPKAPDADPAAAGRVQKTRPVRN